MRDMFRKYMHVERLGTAEVEGIMYGDVYIFPKMDGANHCVWWDTKKNMAKCASRNQELSEGYDSTGFHKYFREHPNVAKWAEDHKGLILYGEFMTPHTIRTYCDSVWGRWFVFDIYDTEAERYIPYTEFHELLKDYNIECLPPMRVLKVRVTPEKPYEITFGRAMEIVQECVDTNSLFMQDGQIGEGVVIKNYGYSNAYGRETWAKVVREDFSRNSRAPGKGHIATPEEIIAEETLTTAFVSKEMCKYEDVHGPWAMTMTGEFIKYIMPEWWADFSFERVAQYKGELDMNALRKAVSRTVVRQINGVLRDRMVGGE